MPTKIFKSVAVFIVLGLLLVPIMTQAATFRGAETVIVNEETEDLYAAGATVNIRKPVQGDLTVAGSTVTINPEVTISDHLNVAGGQLQLDGRVADDARVAGGMVTIGGSIDGDLLAAGGTIGVTGPVSGDIYITGGTISLGGLVEGKVVASGGEIILENGANIKGSLEYTAENPVVMASGAIVGGGTTFHQIAPRQSQWQPNGITSFIGLAGLAGLAAPLVFLLGLAALFLLTLLVVFAAPLKTQDTARNFIKHPWKSLGLGLAYLIATPIVGCILLIIPFTFMVGAVILLVYLLSLFLLPAILAFFIGSSIFRLLHKQADYNRRSHLVWAALLGAAIYCLVMFIPFLGGLIIVIGLIFSAGALVLVVRPLCCKKRDWTGTSTPTT